MFSVEQKRDISDAVQKILRATNHPELPTTGDISFSLNVAGAEEWSFAVIKDNASVGDPGINPHNELMASIPPEEARGLLDKAKTLTGQTPYMPVTDLREQVTAELNQLQDRIALLEGKADGLISRLDHREKTNTPDDHLREIVENKWLDLETRLGKLEERAEINRRLYSELASGLDKLREFFTPIMEDNLIMHHGELIRELQDHLPTQQVMDTMKSYDNRLENLEIAIRQLGSPKVTGGD